VSGLTSLQSAYDAKEGIPFHWQVDYEFTYAGTDAFYELNINSFETSAWPTGGQAVRVLTDPTGRPTRQASSERARGTWIFIYPRGTEAPQTLSLQVSLRAVVFETAQARSIARPLVGATHTRFRFDNVPAQCGEPVNAADAGRPIVSPDRNLTATPTLPSRLLRVPSLAGGTVMPPPGVAADSVRYAWRVGMIWSLAEGVHADYTQAVLWFGEALRRQNEQSDFSLQPQIRAALQELGNNDIGRLQKAGQRAAVGNNWTYARFYFHRAALQGDTQSMASLGYTYGKDGTPVPALERYWCLRAFAAARAGKNQHDLDAVNYFCPKEILHATLSARERADNEVSIARAERKAEDNKADLEATAQLVNALLTSRSTGSQEGPSIENVVDRRTGGFLRSQVSGGYIDSAREKLD
jgi:TPR repeat protein